MRFTALLFACLFTASCTALFYYPFKDPVMNPNLLGLDYEDVIIKTEGEPDLQAWFLPAKAENAPTILFLHGNAGNISTHLASVYWLPAEGFNVFLFDYRGYGNSAGDTEIEGVHKDVERAIAALQARPEITRAGLILYGQSLGATMALYTASLPGYQKSFRAVIAESPFSSYRGIAREKAASSVVGWLFQPLVWSFVRDDYAPAKHLKNITCPCVLIVSGQADEVVPSHYAAEIAEMLAGKAEFWLFPGKGHLEVFSDAANRKRLAEYMRAIP